MTSRSRFGLIGAGILVVGLGVVAKLVVPGLPGDLLGSACYTALLFVVAAFVASRAPGVLLALVAFDLSTLVEALQLTDLPDAVARVAPLSRWMLGSTFVATDLLGYAAGALAAAAVDTWRRRWRARRGAEKANMTKRPTSPK